MQTGPNGGATCPGLLPSRLWATVPPSSGGGGGGGASQALGPQYRTWSGLPGLKLPCGRALMKHP